MKAFLTYLFIGLKYLIIQGIIEMIVIVILEYSGFKVLQDFSKSNLIVENIEGVAWAVSMKTGIISLIYLPLFVIISNLLKGKKLSSNFIFSIENSILSAGLLLTLCLLKHLDFVEILPPLITTLIASFIIIVTVNSKLTSNWFKEG